MKPLEKSDLAVIASYLKNKRVLIVDSGTTIRSTIRKVLFEFGVQTTNVEVIERYEDARQLLESKKFEILITDSDLAGKSGIELIQYHKTIQTDFIQSVKILLSSNASMALVVMAAEEEVDTLISKPFTIASLNECLLSVFHKKATATPLDIEVDSCRRLIFENKSDEAFERLDKLLRENAKHAKGHYLLGQLYLKKGQALEAELAFRNGLMARPDHYLNLVSLIDLLLVNKNFDEAYEYSLKLKKDYPISPVRVPDLVRLLLFKQDYKTLEELIEVSESVEESTEKVRTYVGVALAVTGKTLLKNGTKDQALLFFSKAISLCADKTKLIRDVIESLLDHDLIPATENVFKLLSKLTLEQHDLVAAYYLLQVKKESDPAKSLEAGLKMIRDGFEDAKVWMTVIELSKKTGRRDSTIDELIHRAKLQFPNLNF